MLSVKGSRMDTDMEVTSCTGKKKRKKHGIIRRLLLIVIGLILGINVYLANARGVVGNQLPMPFGYGLANVLSGSMEPTFSRGTLLVVKDTKEIATGDIVVYQSGKELIVHRVIAMDENSGTVITQGDANNVPDPPFEKTQIRGKVVGWIPYMGMVTNALRTPVGILLILSCAFLLIEGSFRKKKEADDQQLDAIKEEIRRLKTELEEPGIREGEAKENRKDEESTEDIENTEDKEHTKNRENTKKENRKDRENTENKENTKDRENIEPTKDVENTGNREEH